MSDLSIGSAEWGSSKKKKPIKDERRQLYPKLNKNRVSPGETSVDSFVDLSDIDHLELSWNNLTYIIETRSRSTVRPWQVKVSRRVILKCLSGFVQSGFLIGIMGPSGCGKSTLLQCLSGHRSKGLSGEISCNKGPATKMAFLAQVDHHLSQLTVRETLLFASKCKNDLKKLSSEIDDSNESNDEKASQDDDKLRIAHEHLVDKILDELGLTECSSVKVNSISGGQAKRLSIASELISKPDLLILDEPTSGLDSSSCYQCVRLLAQLTETSPNHKPLAILTSIHQPSARILASFHLLYILSKDGQCIYFGSSDQLVETLSRVGLKCPNFHNPADFVTEIAYGEYGSEPIIKLAANQFEVNRDSEIINSRARNTSDHGSPSIQNAQTFYHTLILIRRTFLITFREPQLTAIRLITFLIVGLSVSALYGSNIGKPDGCQFLYYTPPEFQPQHLPSDDSELTGENVSYLFFTLLFLLFTAMMPTVLTFPLEMSVFLKEHNNGWYSCLAYYLAKFIADTPFQIIFPILYCTISYFLTNQIASTWRFSLFITICCLLSMLAQSLGLLIGAVCVHSINSAVFIAPITVIPVLLFSGFFVRTSLMPTWLRPLSYISYMRFAFEALISIIYGFGRCDQKDKSSKSAAFYENDHKSRLITNETDWSVISNFSDNGLNERSANYESLTGKAQAISYVMKQFNVNDDDLMINIIILVSFICFLRIISFILFLYKAKKKDQNL